jgi:hypothetical protein
MHRHAPEVPIVPLRRESDSAHNVIAAQRH